MFVNGLLFPAKRCLAHRSELNTMDKLMTVRPKGLVKESDVEAQIQYTFFHSNATPYLLKTLLLIFTLALDHQVTRHLHIYYGVSLAFIYLLANHFIIISKKETVCINKGIGMELIQTTGLIVPSTTHKFIPSSKIVDVVILEGFKGLQVAYYLACIVEGAPKLSLILPDSNLRINDLKTIRHELRKRLFN